MVWCDLMMTMMKWFRLYSLLIIILYTVRIIKPLTLIVTTSRRRFFIRGALFCWNFKKESNTYRTHASLNTLVISYCACRSVCERVLRKMSQTHEKRSEKKLNDVKRTGIKRAFKCISCEMWTAMWCAGTTNRNMLEHHHLRLIIPNMPSKWLITPTKWIKIFIYDY